MIDFKYSEHHEFRPLANLIRRHHLYEKSHNSSRFKEISNDILQGNEVSSFGHMNFININQFSTVVCRMDNQPIGLLIFEHYSLDSSIKTTFTNKGKKMSYSMLGLLGAYVKPDFRNGGIAKEMIQIMNDELLKHHKNTDSHVNLFAATSHTLTISQNCVEQVRAVSSPYNSKVWLTVAKDYFTYHINDDVDVVESIIG